MPQVEQSVKACSPGSGKTEAELAFEYIYCRDVLQTKMITYLVGILGAENLNYPYDGEDAK